MQTNFQHIFFGLQHKLYQMLRDDFPDPDKPVITTNLSFGISKEMFLNCAL